MERLSTQDATFLYVEDEISHMAIAAIGIFDGPPPEEGEIEAMIASKLHLVPRYRQRVRFVPFDIGRPVWCDDPHFSLRYHVRHTALPGPGTEEQLQTLVGRVMSQQLDRTKPLWELWIVEGLEDGGWAMVMKIHHSVVDGVAATDLLTVLLDGDAAEEHPRPGEWEPEREPSPLRLAADAVLDTWTSPRELLSAAFDAPRTTLRKAGEFLDGVATFRRFANLDLESSLNGPILSLIHI
mgnify:CR=1 FL=1